MFTILNRYRGTYGWFAKVNAVVFGLLVYYFTRDYLVAPLCSIGYLIGESFGWGEWVGNLTGTRYNQTNQLEGEGKSNGIYFLSTHIVPNWSVAYLKYCRVALVLRGIYWWLPTLAPLYFVGFSVVSITVAVAVLSIGFPIACELGRLTAPLFSFEYKTFSIKGGWEHQEIWYGLMQDLVLIGLGVSYVMV